MGKPEDIPQDVWDRAVAIETGYEGGEDGRRPVFIARAILSAVEEENEACGLEALRWQDGIDAAEHIRRRNRKGA